MECVPPPQKDGPFFVSFFDETPDAKRQPPGLLESDAFVEEQIFYIPRGLFLLM